MKNRNTELAKNTFILGIGQIIPKLIAVFLLPILTTYLTQKDYGLYELTLSIASFCIPLLSVQIQQAVFRFLLEPEANKKEIVTDSFLFVMVMFIVFSIPIIIIWKVYSNSLLLAFLFFSCYLSEVLLSWIGQVARGLGYNIVYSLAYAVYSVTYIVSLLTLLKINSGLNIETVMIAMLASYLVAFVFLLFRLKIYSYFSFAQFEFKVLKLLLGYSAPMVISSVALWIVNLSDRFFISSYLGLEVTAIYAVANRIPNLFNSMYGIFNLAWTETTSRLSSEEKNDGYYTTFFKEFYQVMVGMMIALICITPFLFGILINDKYVEAYSLMSWLYVGTFLSSVVSFFGSIYVGEKRTKDVGISSAIGAIINILINFILMRRFGVIVAAISTIISYLVICVYRAFDIKKYVTIIYDKKTILIGIVVILIMACLNYSFSIITTIISLIIVTSYNLIFNRKFVANIMKAIMKKIH